MRHKALFMLLLIILSLQSGCLYAVKYDGPYRGKVVDEETREPIEGAVVLGTWAKYHFGVAGGWTEFYDARETVTDKNGEFTIPGQRRLFLGSITGMNALIYKSGYTYCRSGSWSTIEKGIYGSKGVKWEGDMPVFPLRKLSNGERKEYGIPSEGDVPSVLMRREISKERVFQGYSPLTIP